MPLKTTYFKFHFLIFISLFPYMSGTYRNLQCFIKEDNNNKENINLNAIHIIANGTNDVIHYVWSSYYLPSIIVARTTHSTKLHIDLKKLKDFGNDAIVFSEKPIESIGLTFKELWEFYDGKDSAMINKAQNASSLNLESFQWSDANKTIECSSSLATISLQSSSDESCFSKNGTFDIKFSISGEEVIAKEVPHMIFTGNSSQIKLILNNFSPNSTKSRYGVELLAFSFPFSKEANWEKHVSKSIDDEFLPGVFKIIELYSPFDNVNGSHSFLTWRPVSYTGKIPIVANSSDARMSNYIKINYSFTQSIAELYFLSKLNMTGISFNVSFGTSGDGFYSKTYYTSWTLMIGIGTLLQQKISAVVIITISIALCSLLGFFLIGAGYTLYQRCLHKDDDLLLSQENLNSTSVTS